MDGGHHSTKRRFFATRLPPPANPLPFSDVEIDSVNSMHNRRRFLCRQPCDDAFRKVLLTGKSLGNIIQLDQGSTHHNASSGWKQRSRWDGATPVDRSIDGGTCSQAAVARLQRG